MLSIPLSYRTPLALLALMATVIPIVQAGVRLPACHEIPKVLCCTDRVIEKCLSGCVDYITEKCPHKLSLFDKAEPSAEKNQEAEEEEAHVIEPVVDGFEETVEKTAVSPRRVTLPPSDNLQSINEGSEEENDRRRAPAGTSDASALNPAYPVTEVTDKDLTTECGSAESHPPYSPCLSRKNVDDLFLNCCQQHVPSSCHSLCSFEHREHVAAELLIAAVQQEGCDLSNVSKILYCANQNRDNRPCCEYLGLSGGDLGVGDRCLRMCNIGASGDRIQSVTKDDLVCLSNWNVMMYCARAGLRTIN